MTSASTTSPRLSARGVGKAFRGNPALIDVDLDLHGGEMLALVGANGAGKSTLVKIICGAYTADDGAISVDGQPVEIHSSATLWRPASPSPISRSLSFHR